jgi:hypothetical protein
MDWTKCFIRLLNFASSHGVPGLEQISLLPVALLGFTLRVVKITMYVCHVIFPILWPTASSLVHLSRIGRAVRSETTSVFSLLVSCCKITAYWYTSAVGFLNKAIRRWVVVWQKQPRPPREENRPSHGGANASPPALAGWFFQPAVRACTNKPKRRREENKGTP